MAKKKEDQDQDNKKEKEKETVEVEAELLEKVMQKQDKMSEEMEELKEENKKLEAIADQARKQRYEEEHAEDGLVKTVRVPFFTTEDGERLVKAWESGEDTVGYTKDGKPFFKQTMILHLVKEDEEGKPVTDEDGNTEIEKEEIDYSLFYKNTRTEKAEVTEERNIKRDGGETIMYETKLENGREVEIDSKFVNAF